ncbi:hypothetical protein H8959_015931 [Pygathrix nigripes]
MDKELVSEPSSTSDLLLMWQCRSRGLLLKGRVRSSVNKTDPWQHREEQSVDRRGAASGRAEGCAAAAAAAAGPGQDAGLPGPRGEGRAAAAGGGRELSAVLKRRRLRDAGPGAGETSWEFHRDREAGEPSFTGPCRAPEPRGGGGTVRGGTAAPTPITQQANQAAEWGRMLKLSIRCVIFRH